jgi:hypothetical protein
MRRAATAAGFSLEAVISVEERRVARPESGAKAAGAPGNEEVIVFM